MVTGSFRKSSDIDLYFVSEAGHIFFCRWLVTTFIHLTGLRIKEGKEAGRFCPNRFAITSFTEITPHDTYHARVFHNLIPLFAQPAAYASYRQNNDWMKDFSQPLIEHQLVLRHNWFSRGIQIGLERLLGWSWLEKRAKQLQESRYQRDERAKLPGSKVVISERELRFHLPK